MRGAAQGLGFKQLAHGLGYDVNIHGMTDATAAIGICRRRGLGKTRHLAVADVWVQDKLRAREFSLTKVKGTETPSDICTTYIGWPALQKHLTAVGLSFEDGRAETAPSLTHCVLCALAGWGHPQRRKSTKTV